MSILNNTLKSLDDRNQESDFGLPPTVQLRKSFSIRKSLALTAVLILLVWLAFDYMGNRQGKSQNLASPEQSSENTNGKSSSKFSQGGNDSSVTDTSKISSSGKATVTSPNEGMRGIPLSENDRALLTQSTPVIAQVAEQEFEQLEQELAAQNSQNGQAAFDDEAQYRKAAIEEKRRVEARLKETDAKARDKDSKTNKGKNYPKADSNSNTADISANDTEGSIVNNSNSPIKPKTQKQQSADHLETGLKAYQFGMFEDAEKSFSQALKVDSQNHEARKQLAAVYFGKNNIPMALSVLSEGVSIEPQSLVWRELMGKILIAKNRFEEALSIMPESLNQQAVAEQRSDYLIIKGTAAQAINKPEIAIAAFSAMTVLQPQNGKWWLALGANYDQLGQNDEAIMAFETALDKGGVSPASMQYVIERLNALKEVR